MSGTLYVVATPIGNLEDITLRALRVLREVALVAAEDTRRTAKLLTHYGISTRTTSFHEHNIQRRMPELMGRLKSGESVALVSDAGTPLVSDPGLGLVRACIDEGIAVEPVPGPSAPLAALVASGFPAQPVSILGFAPSRASDRKKWLEELRGIPHTVVFFEAPHRMPDLLRDAASILGKRLCVIGRELTKMHQEFIRGTASQLAERLNVARGEFTVVIGPQPEIIDKTVDELNSQTLWDEFSQLTKSGGYTRRRAITELSRRHARPSREIYAALEQAKASVP